MALSTDRHSGDAVIDVRAALKEGITQLRDAKVRSETLAAELLLMHALGCDRAWLYTHPETPLDRASSDRYLSLIARRAAGEPTQYLTGKQEFWGLEFHVTPAVLIPRPETEHVVEVALERLGPRGIKIRLDTGAPSESLLVGDVGTGSGCLAVALAHELPHARLVATDISTAALDVARGNAARHGVSGRIEFLECNLLDAVAGACPPPTFDLIVSNPPYVAQKDAHTLAREVRDHEPHVALFGGSMGVEIYARLIEQASALLGCRGLLVLELGYNCADHVAAIFGAQPGWSRFAITKDLAGIARVAAGERI